MEKNKWPYQRRTEKTEAKEGKRERSQSKRKDKGTGHYHQGPQCAIGVWSAGGPCAPRAEGVCAALERRGANSMVSRSRVSCVDERRDARRVGTPARDVAGKVAEQRAGSWQDRGRTVAGCCAIAGQRRRQEQGDRRAGPRTETVQQERRRGEKGWRKKAKENRCSGSGGTRDPRQAGEQGPASKDTKQAGRKTQERAAPL